MTRNRNQDPRELLDADRDDFERLGARVMALLGAYLRDLPEGAAERVIPEAQRRLLSEMPLPEQGMEADAIIDFLSQQVLPWPQPTGHPRSYAWVNSPPMPIAVLSESVAQAMNSSLDGFEYSGLYLMAGLGHWLMELVGFPDGDDAMALLFSGGSAASLNALSAARYRAAKQAGWDLRVEGLQSGRPAMTVYTSDQAHSSVQRCIEQLGLGQDYLRLVPSDSAFRMEPGELSGMIRADRDAGLLPMAVVATAGTTNVGAIDPLEDIADVCEREGAWLHVDAAYGGFAALDPLYTGALAGLARADSVTVDPHKWLQVPLDCGALLTRHRALHREAFVLTPDYLSEGDPHAVPWPYEHMFQLTYANRAIKTWAAIARLGRQGIARLVQRHNHLASLLAEQVEAADDLELLAPASLSVVNFRYRPAGAVPEEEVLDALNRRIATAINESGEAHLATTRVRGRVSLRACFLHYDNDEGDVEHLLRLVRRIGASETD